MTGASTILILFTSCLSSVDYSRDWGGYIRNFLSAEPGSVSSFSTLSDPYHASPASGEPGDFGEVLSLGNGRSGNGLSAA